MSKMITLKQYAENVAAIVAEVGDERASDLKVAFPSQVTNPDATYPGLCFASTVYLHENSDPHGWPDCVVVE